MALLMPPAGAAGECDLVAGERLFEPCRHCHRIERDGPGPRSGPYLSGLVGRQAASAEDFRYYSQAMKAYGEAGRAWDRSRLSAFIENPQQEVAGTKMLYLGMPDPEERANLVCYIATLR
jgi:cytochrome c